MTGDARQQSQHDGGHSGDHSGGLVAESADESRIEGEAQSSFRERRLIPINYDRRNGFFSDYLDNISRGVAHIKSENPQILATEAGTELILEFQLPNVRDMDQLDRPLRIFARARPDMKASDSTDTPDDHGIGLECFFRDEKERQEFERRIEKIMVESLGMRLYTRLMEHSQDREAGGQPISSLCGTVLSPEDDRTEGAAGAPSMSGT